MTNEQTWSTSIAMGGARAIYAGMTRVAEMYGAGEREDVTADAGRIVTAMNERARMHDALAAIADMQVNADTDHAQLSALCIAIANIALSEPVPAV